VSEEDSLIGLREVEVGSAPDLLATEGSLICLFGVGGESSSSAGVVRGRRAHLPVGDEGDLAQMSESGSAYLLIEVRR